MSDPDHAYGYAKSADFISIMQTTSGEDLSEFFDDWLYNQGYPTYTIEWHQPTSNDIGVRISQLQSHPSVSYFEAPVPLRILGTQGEVLDLVLNNTTNNQQFLNTIDFTVSDVIFDPEFDLISRNNDVQLDVTEKGRDLLFLMYPNPASNIVYIQKQESLIINEVRIYNALGQLLSQKPFESTLDVSNFATGTLYVQFLTDGNIITKPLLKK